MDGLAFASAVVTGVVFLVSGFAKIRAGSFAVDLAGYDLLPQALIGPGAAALPWVEIGVGGALLAGLAPAASLTVAAVLLTGFTAGMVVNLLRGRTIDCGCRGARTPISWRLVSANVLLLLAIVASLGTWAAPVLPTLFGNEQRLTAGDSVAVLIVLAASVIIIRVAAVSRELVPLLRFVATLHGPAEASR